MKEETEKDKDALEMRWPNKETNMEANMETKMDANMIDNIETNYKNINRETGAILDRIAIQVEELVKAIKKKSSSKLPSDTKNDDIRKCENITLSLEDELSSPTLDEDKDIMECDKMSFILEGEFKTRHWLRRMSLPLK